MRSMGRVEVGMKEGELVGSEWAFPIGDGLEISENYGGESFYGSRSWGVRLGKWDCPGSVHFSVNEEAIGCRKEGGQIARIKRFVELVSL